MQLYNTRTQEVERFQPESDVVSIYVCGITPYDTTHLGHAFTYAAADVLIRYLEYQGLTVQYVQNVTDIDDDILRKAKEIGQDWAEVGNRWTVHFIQDMQTLNVRPPDHFPRATSVIPQIIETVRGLLAAGVAYEAGGNVYFRIDDWPEFGKLSRLPRKEMLPIANQRGNHPDDPNKRDPLDFVLWQAQAEGEPAWESPWGMGRPGWHIECSTIATHFLGKTIDIHSGGDDLLFPHHECEIAQVEPISGQEPFARFWMHTAMVHHDGEKMSKSLGNLIMVQDLFRQWSPDAIRFYLASHHYRAPWSYDEHELAQAEDAVEKMRQAVVVSGGGQTPLDPEPSRVAFEAAMDDDLDSARAAQLLIQLGDSILQAVENGAQVLAAQNTLRSLAALLGLRLDAESADAGVITGWAEHRKAFGELPIFGFDK